MAHTCGATWTTVPALQLLHHAASQQRTTHVDCNKAMQREPYKYSSYARSAPLRAAFLISLSRKYLYQRDGSKRLA